MSIRIRRSDSESDAETPSSSHSIWLCWMQQAGSVVYLVGGVFLIYQYWANLPRRIVLVTGVLFTLYGLYRFNLVRRFARGRRRIDE